MSWPQLGEAALRGFAGEMVRTFEPHSEADPVGLLLTFLVAVGSSVGPGPHAFADGATHPGRLNVVLVGDTSRGRKGTASANTERLMALADPEWVEKRIMGGLGSGEGLIAAVADPEDGSTVDKRLMVLEPEFARVLAVAAREGNTLSAVIRQAWDSGRMRVMTRRDPLVATGAHVSLVAHVTVDELRKRLTEQDQGNGFANRHLFALVRRSKLLPAGGSLEPDVLEHLGQRCRLALQQFRRLGRFHRTSDAEVLWSDLYARMANGPSGLVGAVTARAEAQTLRLSVLYAGLDGTSTITVDHLESAWAVWSYCEASARHIFGDHLGDEIADKLYRKLLEVAPAGLDGSEQRDLFSRNVSGARLERARDLLAELGLAETLRDTSTGGRPRIVTFAETMETTMTTEEVVGSATSYRSSQ